MAASVLPFKSLDGATATGAGSVLDLGGLAQKFQMVITATGLATSSPFSSAQIVLEGSLDGSAWYPLVGNGGIAPDPVVIASGLLTGSASDNRLAKYVRANITQLVPGGGSPVITAVIAVGGE